MYGWMGSILRIDLSSGKINREPLSKELALNYLGGRGINVRILYDEVKPGTDGLDPNNVLIFGTGPLTGTSVASGRLNITAMSPLTKILGDSNAGSHFSPELKFSGYDHIVFTGKAEKPVYLWINDDIVELRDAQHLWGKMTDETQEILKADLGDPTIQIACIGPAGENLVRLAAIVVGTDGACGRCGLGAVMGSKNLKAVVVKGTKGVKVAEPDGFRKYVLDLNQRMMQHRNYHSFSTYGTTALLTARHMIGGLALRNGQHSGGFSGFDEIKAETIHNRYNIKDKACFGCVNHCRNWFEIKDGPYAGLKGKRIELSIQESWGSLNENSYLPSLFKGYILCNQYGIDASECGQLLAAATEWHERGLISTKDLEGTDLRWGNHEAMIEMVHKIANREGIGDLLAEDAVRAAKKIGRGAEKFITHSKRALKTNVDLRVTPTYAFGHAVATRGADHLRGSLPAYDGPGQYEGVAQQIFNNTYTCTVADALELCKFNTPYLGMEMILKDMVELFSLATGIKIDEEGIKEIGDRILTLERAFIVREGISRKDDILVGRYMDEPVRGGPWDGLAFDREKWDKMLDEYYDLVGWDKETGVPTRAKLEELGLQDVTRELEKLGKL
ncbi:aldehyde ferredoxin oxidoreductase family protein [Chloroflexota bacterium]